MAARQSNVSRRAFLKAGAAAPLTFLAGCTCLKTQDQRSQSFSFGVITDVQYADVDPGGTRMYRQSPAKLKAAVAYFNTLDLAFVIHLGDLIDRDFVSFDTVMPIMETLKAPVYQVLGNHDYNVADDKKAAVPSRMGLSARYYDFVVGTWRFVVLDGNDQSLQAYAKDSAPYKASAALLKDLKARKAPNAQDWNGGIGSEQLAWLQQRLAQAAKASQSVIVFCHWPVWPAAVHTLWNDTEVISVLESFDCVKAYMCGHNHAGDYAEKRGIHYVTFKGMVNGADRTSYGVVHCTTDAIEITGFGDEPSRHLT